MHERKGRYNNYVINKIKRNPVTECSIQKYYKFHIDKPHGFG
jgi:hypothetical protein